MIYINHKVSILLKFNQITLKIIFSNAFSRSITVIYLFICLFVCLFIYLFVYLFVYLLKISTAYNDKKFKAWKQQKIQQSVIKDIRNLFKLKKEVDDTTIKDLRYFFRLKKEIDDITIKDWKKENKVIKKRIFRDLRSLFEREHEDYYKLVRAHNFWNNDYIEHESNND